MSPPASIGSTNRARMPTRRPGVHWTGEAIIAAIISWHELHGRIPAAGDWHSAGDNHPTNQTVRRVFGGWDLALEAAAAYEASIERALQDIGSLPRAFRSSRRAGLRWTPELISYAVRIWYRRHNRLPSPRDWGRAGDDNPCGSTVIRIFGSWEKAMAFAEPSLTQEQAA